MPHFWCGEWHEYVPDMKILFSDGSIQIWEIKPANQTDYEQNKCKWASAHNHCEHMGWEFVVQTEQILDTYRWKVQRQLNEANKGR